HARQATAERATPENGPRPVLISRLVRSSAASELSLPGTVVPVERAVINGMVAGVVTKMNVNIGDVVKKGQVIALIDAPEMSAQLASARARVSESEKNLDPIRQRSQRVQKLAETQVTSQQEADAARMELNSAVSAIERNKADAQRYNALVTYQRVVAPFDGTITRRVADPGAVVTAGQTPIVEIATAERLKITIDVPQSASSDMQPGRKFRVTSRGARAPIEAPILRTAGAIDPLSRTLRVELEVPPGSGILAGAYVTVQVKQAATSALLAPAGALANGAAGPQLLVVTPDNRAQRRNVRIVRDLGRELEVEGDVHEGEPVVLFPPVDLATNEPVAPSEAPKAKPGGSGAPAGSGAPVGSTASAASAAPAGSARR
ncbi:MAG: efflux RND transporter periplasmic adaptor subunit, partial [Myxococcales bacterium]